MSFTKISWCKQAILLITITCCYGGKAFASLAEKTKSANINNNYKHLQINYSQKQGLTSSPGLSCSEINLTYQEVYKFKTENYYINICRVENDFYYYRQSKSNAEDNLLVPAQPVFGGDIFKATSGKEIYFIGKDSDRYYSSVMLNDNEIVLEPELIPTPITFSQDIVDSGVSFFFGGVRLNSLHNPTNASSIQNIPQNGENSKYPLICVKDDSVLDPNFNDWQSLLGKSTATVNEYAINNGHNFVYHDDSRDRATIKTKEGKIVDLNIAATSEIVEQVCIKSTENI